MEMEDRSLLSLLSVELQTAQWHPIIGTPPEVPEPKIVIIKLSLNGLHLKIPVTPHLKFAHLPAIYP